MTVTIEEFAEEIRDNLERILSAPDSQIRELLYDYMETIFEQSNG